MVPFDWEEKPGTPKPRFSSAAGAGADDDDFAFDFEARGPPPELAAADELFDRGRIRPLKPPPRLQHLAAADDRTSAASSPRSPRIRALLSPRRRRPRGRGSGGEEFDPFVAAMAEATKERGRDPSFAPSRSRSRKGSRSLSPLRVGVGVVDRTNPFVSGASHSISKSTNGDGGSTNGGEEEEMKQKKRASSAAPVHFFSCFRFNPVVNRFARGFSNSAYTRGHSECALRLEFL
ncbi:hypothetical protein ACMD2_13418 [Ananas comosus]|uniref:Uncharacterized protein n=1 Tax=Ananas comosus TaxID=4615 RepID=A0A199VZ60_ANACO|nr:hypothetical protein ACMD2_13418 [Ananas comosus]